MFEFIKRVLKVSRAVVWVWIAVPLIAAVIAYVVINPLVPSIVAIIANVVINPLANSFTGPESYNVFLVGDFTDENNVKLRDAFLDKQNLELNRIKIKFKYVDAQEKDAESIAAKLANEENTLMVVGHLSSTATKNALPHYLNAIPPIPVIMVTETTPLLPQDYTTIYYPVFRLAPTDEEQAKKAANFAVEHGAKAIWVVEDAVTNPIYSNYLAREFVKKIHELKSSKVVLRTTNLESPSADAVKALRINLVFFAGSWSSGLILTRQVKEMWNNQPKPELLLSSTCANSELLKEGGADMNGVFLIYPMLARDFYSRGFAYWGALASELSIKLVEETDNYNRFEELAKGRSLGSRSLADARNALRAFMEMAVNLQKDFDLGGQRYTFKRDGQGTQPPFHVWQVQTSGDDIKFVDIEK